MSNNTDPRHRQSGRLRSRASSPEEDNAASSNDSLPTSKNVDKLLARAAAGAQAATGPSTYEAKEPGSLERIAKVLRYSEQQSLRQPLRHSLRHITFHHVYDRADNSGVMYPIREAIGVYPENLTLEEMQIEAYAHLTNPSLSPEDLNALHTRFVLARKLNTMVSNEYELLKVYGAIFQKCNIHTVAVPASWLELFTQTSLTKWFRRNFHGVVPWNSYRYMLDGRRYILFGSSRFVGDRARDGEETWSEDNVQQVGDGDVQEEDIDSASAEEEQEEVIVISSAEEDSDSEPTEEE